MNTPDYLISTPENVDLHLELAGVGNRILAAFIDHAIIAGIIGAIAVALGAAAWSMDFAAIPENTKNLAYLAFVAVGLLLVFVINFGYFIVFEGIWHGQTPGKRIAGIRVIEDNGQPVTWSAVFIRNLLRLIDELPAVYPGILPMLIDKNERRLGDFAAGTLVIKERVPVLSNNNLRIAQRLPVESNFDVGQISADEYNLLSNFLKRRELLLLPQRQRLAADLAAHYTQKLDLKEQLDSPELFLEKLYAGYINRAQTNEY